MTSNACLLLLKNVIGRLLCFPGDPVYLDKEALLRDSQLDISFVASRHTGADLGSVGQLWVDPLVLTGQCSVGPGFVVRIKISWRNRVFADLVSPPIR